VLSIFFAGISGSSTADAASQGKIFIEAQVKEGYDLSFSVAITAVSAVLAVIIPPSILMIVWGGTLSVSIGALFLAGILPGLLLGFVQMATVHVYAKLRNYPKYPRSTLTRGVRGDVIVDPGADDAGDHHRRQDLRLVHRHRVGGDRRDLRRRALDLRLPRAERPGPLRGADRHRQAGGGGPVLRRHRQRLRLAARLLPDPEGAACRRRRLGHGHHPDRLLHRLLLPRRRLLPRRHPAIIIVGTILEPLAGRCTWTRCTSR
jgi:TRAP-type mannitol/chloroaromatic compound transport system permease large subunit